MKVIVAGSRTITDEDWVHDVLTTCHRGDIDEVVCGMAMGSDLFGKNWANQRSIPVKEMPANWEEHGKAAGYIRNGQMAGYADALIAFWDGKSRGTKHMIDYMLAIGKEVHVYQRTV